MTILERDARIWIMRRGDGMTLKAIGLQVGLHPTTVSARVARLDVRLTRGWAGAGADPAWGVARLRAAGALASRAWLRPRAYEAFESTDPKRSERDRNDGS